MNKINPFNPQLPADPKYFVDRKDIIEKFQKNLDNGISGRPINMAVLGDWGIGKTSLLTKINDLALKTKLDIATTFITLTEFSFIDIDSLSVALFDEIKKQTKTPGKLTKWFSGIVSQWELITLDAKYAKFQKKKIDLINTLESFWNKISKKVKLIIIFLDDFYLIKKYASDLRNVFQELNRRGAKYMLVISGPTGFSEWSGITDKVMRFFDYSYLKPFDMKYTKNMILLPIQKEKINLEIKESVTSVIHEKTEGHPYFISLFMHELLNKQNSGIITYGKLKNYFPNIIKSLEHRFVNQFEILPIEEQKILRSASKLKRDTFSPKDIPKVHIEFLTRLCDKHLLIKRKRGEYQIYHPLFKDFLKRYKS